MQSILAVPDTAVSIKLDGLAGQAPFTALDGCGHRLDAAAGDLAVGSTTVQPFLGQFGSDSHNLEVQVRPSPGRRLSLAVALWSSACAGCLRAGGSGRGWHRRSPLSRGLYSLPMVDGESAVT